MRQVRWVNAAVWLLAAAFGAAQQAGKAYAQAASPDKGVTGKAGAPEPASPTTPPNSGRNVPGGQNGAQSGRPVPATTPGVTPPQLESGQTSITVDKRLTPVQQKQVIGDLDSVFSFVSKDSGLPIREPIKHAFLSRDDVNRYLRKKFDEDKDTKRMERSELVLKKFGLLDRDFHLRPFLLSLLTEQIAGFYDTKTKTMNLLDWVPIEDQRPVMAHELTHALQNQHVDLDKWQDQEMEGVAKNVKEDNEHIRTDETDTTREAVLEGQAMVTFVDFRLQDEGRQEARAKGKPAPTSSPTLRDVPELPEALKNAGGDTSDSPVLARAPLLLQQALVFPYVEGLAFEHEVLIKRGTQGAFAGAIDSPPNTTAEIMHPDQYLAHTPEPVLHMPDIHLMLEGAGFVPYDVGVMGEFDVRVLAELFGGRPLASALAPAWRGGVYYAAQRKVAREPEKETPGSLGLLYCSQWSNPDSARSFFKLFDDELPRQYDGLERREKDEGGDDLGAEERVYSTREGDVLLAISGSTVWVSEGFDLALARKLESTVEGAQGAGPVRQAAVRSRDLIGGMSGWLAGFGMVRTAAGIH